MTPLIEPTLRERITRSYSGGDLTCQALLALLEGRVSPGAQRARNELVRLLADAHQHRNLKAHNVGSPDRTVHYTIFIDGSGYHLRLDAQGVVFQITDKDRRDLGSVPPWVPPGAAPPRPKSP